MIYGVMTTRKLQSVEFTSKVSRDYPDVLKRPLCQYTGWPKSSLTNFILYILTTNNNENFVLTVLMHQYVGYKCSNFHSNRPPFASTQAWNLRRQELIAVRIECIESFFHSR